MPLVVQRTFRCLERRAGVLLLTPPAAEHVLAELVFPGMTGFAALAPVEDEIFQLIQCEGPRYVVVQCQQLQQILARRPARGQQSCMSVGAGGTAGLQRRAGGSTAHRGCGGRRRRSGSPPVRFRWGFVQGVQNTVDADGRIEQNNALGRQTGANTLQVLIFPEWQLSQQLRAFHSHPVAAITTPDGQVVKQAVQELQQNGLFQPQSCRQAGREDKLLLGNERRFGHRDT